MKSLTFSLSFLNVEATTPMIFKWMIFPNFPLPLLHIRLSPNIITSSIYSLIHILRTHNIIVHFGRSIWHQLQARKGHAKSSWWRSTVASLQSEPAYSIWTDSSSTLRIVGIFRVPRCLIWMSQEFWHIKLSQSSKILTLNLIIVHQVCHNIVLKSYGYANFDASSFPNPYALWVLANTDSLFKHILSPQISRREPIGWNIKKKMQGRPANENIKYLLSQDAYCGIDQVEYTKKIKVLQAKKLPEAILLPGVENLLAALQDTLMNENGKVSVSKQIRMCCES